MRSQVELLIPQLQFLDSEGAQEELWGLTRIFVDTIIQETGGNQVFEHMVFVSTCAII